MTERNPFERWRVGRCMVCGYSHWKDGTRRELNQGTACGRHSGKWMCMACFRKTNRAPATRVVSS